MKARALVSLTERLVWDAEAPVAVRPTPEGVYVAAAAAGPLGGDEVCVELRVGAGRSLRVLTVGASVALAGTSRWCWHCAVGDGGRLELLPEPTVVTARAAHSVCVRVTLAGSGRAIVREEVVLGRHGETGGSYASSLHVDRDGAEVVVTAQRLSGTDPVSLGPYGTGGRPCAGTLLDTGGAGADGGDDWCRSELAAGGTLTTAVAADALRLRRLLDPLVTTRHWRH